MTSLAQVRLPAACFYTCEDCFTRAELDDAVAARVGETTYTRADVDELLAGIDTQAEVDALVTQVATDALAEVDT